MSDNNHWYSIGAATDYPLSDAATAIADDGTRLPSNVLVDLHLRYPDDYGTFPFLGALTVTSNVVAVVVEVAQQLTPPYDPAPLAVLSVLAAELVPGRQYALQAQTGGVAGWLAFGSGAIEFGRHGVAPLRLRFSNPAASLLAARAARGYRRLPVQGIGSYTGARTLGGVVDLAAEPPLEVARETRVIGGVTRDVVVVRLTSDSDGNGFEVSEQEQALDKLARRTDTLERFIGPCGSRPESGNCGDPQPVEFINSVAPDCAGVLTLDIRGCATAEHVADPCTVLLDCAYALDQVCPPPFIPDNEGRLPSEYTPADIVPPDANTDSDTEDTDSETRVDGGYLPFVECFDGAPVPDFVTKSGSWELSVDDSPFEYEYCFDNYTLDGTLIDVSETDGSYESQSLGVRNLTVWEGFDLANLGRVTTVDMKMMAADVGGRHNGGIVLNYRPHQTVAGRFVYHLVDVDYDTQQVRVRRFDGLDFVTISAVSVPGILLGRWLRLTATVVEGPAAGLTRLTFTVVDLEGTLSVSIGPVDVASYAPSTGYNGLHADRAHTRFSFFSYAEAT